MELLSKDEQVAARIMQEMGRQSLSAALIGPRLGWSPTYVMLRLGLLLPIGMAGGRLGGRYPLNRREVENFAHALRVPVDQLLGKAESELALAS
jgi:hypothetical protein